MSLRTELSRIKSLLSNPHGPLRDSGNWPAKLIIIEGGPPDGPLHGVIGADRVWAEPDESIDDFGTRLLDIAEERDVAFAVMSGLNGAAPDDE
jgi:hypothetical protein